MVYGFEHLCGFSWIEIEAGSIRYSRWNDEGELYGVVGVKLQPFVSEQSELASGNDQKSEILSWSLQILSQLIQVPV